MNARGLEGVRNALLEAYVGGVIDDSEFAVLLDENESRPIFPYWKVDKFSLDNWDDTECHTELRFKKGDLYDLKRCLRIPDMIQCVQGTICEGMEAMCILLKRLAYPCRYTDLVGRFGRNPTELCLIFNNVLDKIYDTHHHRLNSWNQPFLQPAELHRYARSIYDKGAPLDNCFGFIDGTVRPICRPNINQRVMYNGHKRVHGIKFQSVVVPNGLIANLSGPYEGKKHDSMMLNESGLLGDLELNANYMGQPLCLYGDPAYPLRRHLQAPYRNRHLTPAQQDFNTAMCEVRESVEWLFGQIVEYFKFIDFKKQMKVNMSAVGKMYTVAALLQNAHTCLYGNNVSDLFQVDPPILQDYFA